MSLYLKDKLIAGVDNSLKAKVDILQNEIEELKPNDTGWVNLTFPNDNYGPLNNSIYTIPAARRINNIIYLKGMIRVPKAETTSEKFASIPNIEVYKGMPERFYLSTISATSEVTSGGGVRSTLYL